MIVEIQVCVVVKNVNCLSTKCVMIMSTIIII